MIFIWQGLDFTDTGFVLTNYQQIFNDPTSVETSFRLWLSNILGGLWVYFFGDSLGLIGYKIAAVLLVWTTLYGVYLTLREHLPETQLLWGLLLALIFINRSDFQLNYNSFTAFFFVFSAYYLSRGLREDKNWFIFVSALLLGLNIFIRLPNILGFLLIASIFFFGKSKQVRYFIFGYGSAIIGIVTLMYFMGHLEAYINSFVGTFSMLTDPGNHHSSGKLSSIVLTQHGRLLLNLGFVLLQIFLLGTVLSITRRFNNIPFQRLVIVTLAVIAVYVLMDSYQNRFRNLITILGILYFFLALIVFKVHKAEKAQLALIALMILIVAPLGSNNGVYNSVYGMYLAIPLVFSNLMDIKELSYKKWQINGSEFPLVKTLAIGLLVIFTLNSTYHFTYRETSHREQLVYQVEHPKLKGIFTTKERATVVQELLTVLPQYVQKDDYLLAYEQIPMLYYLTNTRPYLYGAWPMLFRTKQFEEALNRAKRERPYLPVMVRAKGSTERITWPRTIRLQDKESLGKIRDLMDVFVSENNYKLVWENTFFQILVPDRGAL